MLRQLRSFPLLTGYRDAVPCTVAALEQVLLRVSALVGDHSCIADLDCDPVIVAVSGLVVMDARVRVQPGEMAPPLGARR
jgi:hypothetical protein